MQEITGDEDIGGNYNGLNNTMGYYRSGSGRAISDLPLQQLDSAANARQQCLVADRRAIKAQIRLNSKFSGSGQRVHET